MSSADEPVIFSTVAEGARRAFGAKLTPDLLAKLKAAGMDFEEFQAAYPLDGFLAALKVLADALVPGQPPAEQYRLLGRQFMEGYVKTTIGFASMTMAKVIGVKRTLGRITKSLRTTGNYLEAEVRELGPTEVELVTRVLPHLRAAVGDRTRITAQYRLGVLEGALEQLGVTGQVVMSDVADGEHEARFRISWKPAS